MKNLKLGLLVIVLLASSMGFVSASDCTADIWQDGYVDMVDLGLVNLLWGTDDSGADINGDGLVGIEDLLAVLNQWGACSEPVAIPLVSETTDFIKKTFGDKLSSEAYSLF